VVTVQACTAEVSVSVILTVIFRGFPPKNFKVVAIRSGLHLSESFPFRCSSVILPLTITRGRYCADQIT
jgi:hypothetical protein